MNSSGNITGAYHYGRKEEEGDFTIIASHGERMQAYKLYLELFVSPEVLMGDAWRVEYKVGRNAAAAQSSSSSFRKPL